MKIIKNLFRPKAHSLEGTGRHWGAAELVLLFSILILVVFVAIPVLLILWNAFFVDGKLNLTDAVKVLTEKDTYEALFNSIYIAIGVTILSTIVGVFFAWLIARTDLPMKNLMKVMFLISFMLPSFIGAAILISF